MEKLLFTFKKNQKLPVIFQDESAECGHACIVMICNYFGHNLDLFTLRKMYPTSLHGTNLLEISYILNALKLRTRALKVELAELKYLKAPAILHWNMNHFVILKQVNKKTIVIHDPVAGIKKCTLEEAANSFTGIALEIEKPLDFKPIETNSSLTLLDLIKNNVGINKYLIFLLLLSLTIEAFNLLNPLFIQYVTDSVIPAHDENNLYTFAIAFIFLMGMQIYTEYIRGNMVIYLTNNLTEQLASNIVNHLLMLPLAYFEKRQKGDIQSKFQSIDHIQKKISTDFITTLLDGLMIIVNLMVMFTYSGVLTCVVLINLSIYFLLRYHSYYFLKKQTELSISQHATTDSVFLETLQGMISIKSFLKEKVRFNQWKNSYIKSLNSDIKLARVNLVYQIANQLLFNLDYIVIICIGANLVLKNHFSVGMLVAFLSYRLLLVNKVSACIQNVFDYRLISIQLRRLSDILFQEPEVLESKIAKKTTVEGSLTIKNLTFRYHPNEPFILNKVNLHIKAGEKIAIVGPSGCGKSTFIKLAMGLLQKNSGEIFIDGIAIEEFGLKNYRELTAAVLQDDALLSGSIIENIAFFDENIDIEHVYKVAKLAYIHETIMKLPMKYETLIGEMGSGLSGGQKQRLLLARALYKKPQLLFLDEATSHLDVDNEININQLLKSLTITQLIIAHRKETIAMADRVIYLSDM